MNRKGIFGGTFDPIHNGHLHVAYEALYDLGLDKIIFVPSGNPPHKTEKLVTDSEIRYELVKKAIEDEKRFDVSSYEIHKSGLSYTYETLEHFNKIEPDTEWYFITGTDCLMELNSWKNINRILNSCRFVVFNRSGYNRSEIMEQKKQLEKKYNAEIVYLDIPILDISSTNIRNKIREEKNISYLIPKKVERLLEKMNLYKY
ncbi:nicotinate-nucleotide adenylyltransferase [Clostridium sp. JNZ J1-5]